MSESDVFDVEGSDPENLRSGRIPDPQPEHTPLFRALARAQGTLEERLRARGGRWLRNSIRAFWGVVAAVGVLLLVGPVINEPLSVDDIIASADVDEVDWVARDAHIDYRVERADDGTFATDVSEEYTADFRNGPESTIERTIVTEFEGHDAEFELHGATVDGAAADVDVVRRATTTVIRIERADGEDFEGQPQVAIAYELHHLVAPKFDEATGRTLERWDWPLFAPTWPQATKGIDVSFTFPTEVNDALVREPRAYVGWLLVSGTERLEPDGVTADGVRYSFSNDDALPPNADIWIHAVFEPGTFAQPPKTPLFWVQTYGPLVPLALLVVLLLFAVAARRIVWADSTGRPWFVMRAEPPKGLTPEFSAALLDKPSHAELASALAGRGGSRERWIGAVARAGRRAGKPGNFLSAAHWSRRWRAKDRVVERGLRWVPDSYVRDSLILAPLALLLVQWGLLRQLSHQVILLIVWWPAATVLVSTVLAFAAVVAVARPRPLTREGALAVQDLKGIGVFAETTRLLDRGPVDDPLLPYAILMESPRRSGSAIAELAVIETRDRSVTRGWRTDRFITVPALLALAASVAVLAGSIVTIATTPEPYEHHIDKLTEYENLPGTIYTQVRGFDIDAGIVMGEGGAPRVEVTEHFTVEFDNGGGSVPQFSREWPTERLGQSLGFELESVTIDGEDAPFREIPNPRSESVAMLTQFAEAFSDVHEIEVGYSLASPVVDASGAAEEPDEVQELRWVGMYSFWDHEYYTNMSNPFDGSAPVRPIRVQVTIEPGIAEQVLHGGWIDGDYEQDRVPHENGNWFAPWNFETQYVSDTDEELHDITVGSAATAEDGSLVAVLDFDDMGALPEDAIGKYDAGLTSDLGVRLAFEPDTFPGVDSEAYDAHLLAYRLPYVVLLALGAVVTVAAAAMLLVVRRARRSASASIATVSYLAIPIAAVAQSVLFFWTVGPMAGDDGRIAGALIVGGLMWAASVTQVVFIARALRRRGTSRVKQ